MEKTEPTFIPEWLKSSGGLNTTSHHDEKGGSKSVRNKSLITNNENELGRASVSDRTTTSSYFRRASVNNGSAHLRSYDSFNRKEKSSDFNNRNRDYSDPLGNILPTRFEKDGLRRSHSSVSNKRVDSWPRKISSDLTIGTKSNHNNGSVGVRTSFERDFPSLNDEKDSEIGRVPSPVLSSAIQSLPTGNNAVIGGDGWTSALAEVPVIVGTNGNGPQTGQPNSGLTGGRNMAETLAHGPPRTQTAPQLTVGTQRLEELAVKQSRQLIPMTPSMPKALVDKPKLKVGQSQLQNPHLSNHPHTPRSVPIKPDVSKTSSPTVGKLLVLKPSRERNGSSKDSLSPTSKLPNSPLAVPSVVPSQQKPILPVLEKKPSLQAQSRSKFFNLMRKKSMSSNNSSSESTDASSKSGGGELPNCPSAGGSEGGEVKVDLGCNGDANNDDNNNNDVNVILHSEEEETRFMRSLGWVETGEEEGGLTEEEITSFYQNYLKLKSKSKPGSKVLKGMGECSNSKSDS